MMTPRERVLAAMSFRPPDRTPRDFWAEECTWRRLLDHLGHEKGDRSNLPERPGGCSAQIGPVPFSDRQRVLDELGIDVRHLEMRDPPERPLGGGFFQNFWGERYNYRQTPWGPMREDTRGALAEAKTLADLEGFDWPTPDVFDYSTLAGQCRRLDQYAIFYGFADIWERPSLVRGWEEMFVDMVQRPDWAHFLCRKFTDFYREDYTRAAEATGGRIDLFLVLSDLSGQNGPLVSLPMFREFIAPYIKEMVDCIHGLGAKVLYHSCGQVRPFIPELIALGVDVLDPIQPAGPEMAPERLAAEFAGRICFHGGMDMQHLLPHGTPEQVRAEARRYCQTLGRSGGYILGPAHLFQPDVPPENILAVYQAERDSAA